MLRDATAAIWRKLSDLPSQCFSRSRCLMIAPTRSHRVTFAENFGMLAEGNADAGIPNFQRHHASYSGSHWIFTSVVA